MPADGGRRLDRRAGSTVAVACNSVASSRGGYAMPWPQSGRRAQKGYRHVLPARSDNRGRCPMCGPKLSASPLFPSGCQRSADELSGCQTGRTGDGRRSTRPIVPAITAAVPPTTTVPHLTRLAWPRLPTCPNRHLFCRSEPQHYPNVARRSADAVAGNAPGLRPPSPSCWRGGPASGTGFAARLRAASRARRSPP